MARIPEIDSMRPAQDRTGSFQVADSGFGEAVARVGQGVGRIMEKRKQEIEDAEVFELRRKLNDWEAENIYKAGTGAMYRNGQDAFGLTEELPSSFNKFTQELAKGIKTPRQRELFNQMTLSRSESLTSWAARKEEGERTRYLEGQYKADIDSSARRMAGLSLDEGFRMAPVPQKILTDDPNMPVAYDPATLGTRTNVDVELDVIRARTVKHGRANGWSEEETQAEIAKNEQAVFGTVMETLMSEEQIEAADTFFKHFSPRMDVTLKARYSGELKRATRARRAQVGVDDIMRVSGPAALANTDDMTQLIGVVRMMESGNRDFDDAGNPIRPMRDGKLLSSAKFAMQVIDGTARDPGFGIRPAADPNDPAERNRVGEELLAALVDTFDGDTVKALAAYHDGYGAVLKAIEEGGVNWQSMLSPAGQAYVQKGIGMLDKAQITTGPERLTAAEYDQTLRQYAGNDPDLLNLMRQELAVRLDAEQATMTKAQDDATAAAYRLISDGTPFNDLGRALLKEIPGDRLPALRSFAASMARGDTPKTDWETYYMLRTSPALLQQTDLMTHRGHLDDAEFKELTALQMAIRNDPDGRKWRNIQTRDEIVKNLFVESGENITKKGVKEDLSKFTRMLSERVTLDTPEEEFVQKANQLYAEYRLQRQFMGIPLGQATRRAFELEEEDYKRVVVQIDPVERQRIIGAMEVNNRRLAQQGMPQWQINDETIKHWYMKGAVQ